MKNLYFNSIVKKYTYSIALLAILFGFNNTANAQVRKTFTQRTSQYSTDKKIYTVKGDFTMLGNTCLTPQNYSATGNNNDASMIYVDTDSDANTFNSSSSTLVLSTENGAVPACSNIVYAGLYWTGKSSANQTFDVTKSVATGTQTINNNLNVTHGQSIANTTYSLSVSRSGTNGDRYPNYTFSSGGTSYAFRFYNGGTNRVTVSVNNGSEVNVPVTLNSSGSGIQATLNTPYTITNGTVTLTIKKLIRDGDNNQTTGAIQSTSNVDVNVSGTIITYSNVTKTFDKRTVKLKGPTAASYTNITTASVNDIWFPSGSDDDIFTAYAEITDYVRNNGVIGQYTVADMALLEGNPGGTGYSGGWGIIVVYENSKMKWRDVTIFDGYAYVASTNSSGFDLPVSGFNTVQTGNVGVKLGVMASEGDVGFTGDYFRIRNLATTNYTTLSRTGTVPSPDNFFNSSITAGGTRNPQLANNTGIDIGIIDVPNTGNTVIGNSQTSTNFKYGTSSDTYSIFTIAMSVDAYVPEAEAIITATTINNVPAVQPYTTLPGQDTVFSIDVRNLGSEAINNYKIVVPVPYNASYVAGTASGTIFYTTPNTTITGTFDPSLGATGSIVWNFGTLPLPADRTTLLARLTFKLKATTDCAILSNATCASQIAVIGSSSGLGAITSVALNNSNFIQGYNQAGNCIGQPIPSPINIGINGTNYVTQNCPNTDYTRHFSYCSASTSVGTSEIASNFPAGSLFYNTFPVTTGSVQYTDANPIPLVAGSTVTYYAVPSGGGSGCNFPFTITKCPVIVAQNDALTGGNGTTGNTNAGNVLNNNGSGADTLNGVQATITQVNITVTTPATSIGGAPVPSIDPATGQVSVPAGTPAGIYTIVYNLCEILNPATNCDPATVTITVTAPAIVAQDDTLSGGNGTTGNANAGNVLNNNGNGADTLNGSNAVISLVNITVTTPATSIGGAPIPSLATATGQVSVPAGTPAGTYTIVYSLCEKINPTNCDPATVTITVTAPAIVANDDTLSGGNGTTGNANAGNVLNNNGNGADTLNGSNAVISLVNITVTTPATSIGGAPVPSLATATGQVSVPTGTPAGTYTIVYSLCEKLNPTNCDPATVTITVTAPAIVANDDTLSGGNGTTGNANAGNVLNNNGNGADTLNGSNAVISQVNITVTTPATSIGGAPVPSLATATGQVSVPAGTPAGTYTIVYSLCEKLNPTNCDPATVTITVTAPAIIANDDNGTPINGLTGGTAFTNVLVNDTLNGVPVLASQVNTTFVSSTNPGITLSGTNVLVAPGTPAGSYTLVYQICEILNPTNCDTATVAVSVGAAAIIANDDNGTPVNGLTGGTAFTNVLVNDTLNGVPVLASQVNTTFVSSTNPGITLSGTNVLVAPGTPAGSYTLVYQICEILNPTNCDTATVSVSVGAAAIIANDDNGTPINGLTGGTAFTNVLVNDTLNDVPVLASQVNTTFVSSTNPGITLSGTDVLVAPGTPAGSYTLVYQICEILNPTNCDTATVAVSVGAAAIIANDDNGTPINGLTGGTAFTNVLVNDTLNGVPVLASQVNTTFVSSTNPGITLSGTDALVAPGTPAGSYTLVYQICEILNPTNCDTATVAVSVGAAAIIANDDNGTPINGLTGGTAFTNVLVNDTLNGVPVLASQVNTTFVSSTNPGITLSGTNVLVAPGTPAGSYTLVYQICEILNPTNCDTATVAVSVGAAAIIANDDNGTPVNGLTGGTAFTNVLVNDTLNGVPVLASQVNTTFVSSTNPGITLSGTNVLVAPGTPAGSYTLVYQICEILNPTNCDTATVSVSVGAAAIIANDDNGTPINGLTGGTAFTNVLVNDTLNGVPVLASQVNSTFVSSTNVGITLSGTDVVVAPGTPAGSYTLVYQICEILNPTNCDTATVSVSVGAAAIIANDDNGAPVNGLTGGTAFTNVLVNDTLNGVPVLASQVTTTFVSSTNVGITLSGTNVLVAPGTPAGSYTLVYQICEILNPTNCDTATVSVSVGAAAIIANDDNGAPINGLTGGTAFTNVLVNDTLNGVPVLASQVNTTFVSSTNPGITLSGTNVLVAPGTPAGSYTLVYQICEILNPTNCDTATVAVSVGAAAIIANDDNGTPVNGLTGGTAFTNVLVNDTLNGVPVLASQVNTTFVSSTNPGITLSGTNVLVAPGTPAGSYTLVYQICEILNPTNCDTATVSVSVGAAAIIANDDNGTPINGLTGGTAFTNVLVNDTLNGVPVLASQVNTTFVSSTNPGITLSGTNVLVAPGTPAGSYTLVYQICEILNPTNCDTATVSVSVGAAAIIANDDNGTPVNGLTGGTAFTNVLVNDTLNGVPVLASQVNSTFVSSTNPGITLSGTNVLVAPGTPAGSYTLVYQICEILNPTNCDTATVSVSVGAAAIIANDDNGTPVNGLTGGTAFTNVLVNDTLNGVPVLASQVTTTFVSSTNVGITLSGTDVVVAPGTPAGSYTLVYQICEILNPTNCDTATVSVSVGAAAIIANDDNGAPVNGLTGGTAFTNVLVNDTLNGVPVLASQVTTTFVSSTNVGITLSGTDVVVAPGTPAGSYTLVYQICEILNPTNCDTATVSVSVGAATIVAANDNYNVDCANIGTIGNVLSNDSLNNINVTIAEVNLSIVNGSYPNLNIDANGNVLLTSIGQCGDYTFTYQICEKLNPDNCDTATATITIIDNTPPIWTSTAGSLDITLECSDTTALNAAQAQFPIAIDNCDSDVTNVVKNAGQFTALPTCPNAGTYTNTWTVTDACNNVSTTFTQTITIQDTTAPTWSTATGSLDITVECSDTAALAAAQGLIPVASDLCDTDVTNIIKNEGNFIPTIGCDNTGTYTNEWTVTDACSNESVAFTQIITVVDTTPPTIDTAAANAIVQCDGNGNTTALQAWLNSNGGAIASDTCSNVVWSNNYTSLTDGCGNTGTTTVTFTATDGCNNTTTTSATFTIEDTTAPTIDTPAANATVQCDGQGNTAALQAWLNSNGGASASDVCSNVTWTNNYTELSDGCGNSGSASVTFTATDDCGNTSTTSAIFTIEDTTAPTINTAATDLVVQCDGGGNTEALQQWIANNGGASASDICSNVTWSNDFNALANDCSAAVTVTFTATDDCGNATSTSATFTVQDIIAPTIDTAATNATAQCDGQGNTAALQAWLSSNGGASASDTCSGVTWSNNFETLSDGCGNTGTATVTFTATDGCGNATTTSASFTIEDTTAPTIDTPAANATAQCDGQGNTAALQAWLSSNGGASASDTCSGVTWSNNFETLSDGCGNTGTATVTFTATDGCGNATTTSASFTIEDTTAPTIDTAAANATVQCDGQGNTAALQAWLSSNGGASATDVCSNVTWTNSFDALSDGCGNSGSATVTFTATDDCGNATTTSATFTIEDTTAPTIDTAAANATVQCDGQGNTAALQAWLSSNGGAVASDICSNVIWTNNYTELSDGCGNSGSASVTFTATDDCGNATITSATFTIEDTTAPTIDTAATDLVVQCDGGGNTEALQQWIANNGGASASDICSNVTWSNDFNALANDCSAAVTVTFTATDDCGNATSTSATFTVQDIIAPTIDTAATNATVECNGQGNTAALQAWLSSNGGASASDTCSGVTWSNNFDTLSDGCGQTGSASVTFTATDDCGNATTTSATFTIEDTTAPTIDTAAANATVQCDGQGNTAALQAWLSFNGGAVASDICSNVTWTNSFDALSDGCGNSGSASVTFTATDDCGNAKTTSATFTIEDTTAPIIDTAAANATVQCDGNGNTTALTAWLASNGGATASDTCSNVTWTNNYTELSDGCGNSGSASVTFTATDDCGNATTTSATFTIEDTTAPTIDTAAANATVQCDGQGNTAALQAWLSFNGGAVASDICSNVTWTNSFDALSDGCGNSGSASVTFTATDDCGNAKTTSATFTIEDTTAPIIDTAATDLVVQCDGNGNTAALQQWIANNGGASASDVCSNVTWSNNFNTIANDCSAAVTVIFTATDDCGNATTSTASFTIEDSTNPVAPEAPATLTVACATDVPAMISLTANDNCAGEITVEGVDATTPGNCPNSFTVTRTWTFTDACNNSSSVSQTINVVDDQAPVTPEAPATLTVACATDVPAMISLTANDNCAGEITVEGVDATTPGNCPNSFTVTRTWTFTDACNNSSSVSQNY